jgi:hypothetical protein
MSLANLFARVGTSLFGGPKVDPAADVDAALLNECVDAIVEAVDPRLRLMPRYRDRLAPSAIRGIRFLRSLAPDLPASIELSRPAWATDPYIGAFFAKGSDVQVSLERSAELGAFFRDPANLRFDRAYCVLGMRREERNVLASALVDGEVRRDVAQTTVGFASHTLFGTSADALSTRGLLGEAILKRLAGLALERIVAARDRAIELETRKSMLATRLRMLNLRRGGLQQLVAGEQDSAAEIAALERELKATAGDHLQIKTSLATLDHSFAQIEQVLGEPERHLGLNLLEMRVSHTGYKLDAGSRETAAQLCLNELWIGSNLRAVIVPVHVPRSALA